MSHTMFEAAEPAQDMPPEVGLAKVSSQNMLRLVTQSCPTLCDLMD